MAESVRDSVKRAMGRSVEEPPKKEPMRTTIIRSIDQLNKSLVAYAKELREEEKKEAKEPEGPTYNKAEVDYGEGTRKEHCGLCEYYQVMHKDGCALVKGYIEYDMWCRLFEEKPDEGTFVDE